MNPLRLAAAITLAGGVAVTVGVAFVYWPASLMVGGFLLMAAGVGYLRGVSE